MGGFTLALAERVAAQSFGDLPDDVVEIARQCVLDWLGVTVAGSREPTATIVVDDVRADGLGDSGVTVVGTPYRLPPLDAALVNGTASHALDYDDVNETMLGHPSVPILGALLAVAQSPHARGGH